MEEERLKSFKTFEEMEVWQDSRKLVRDIYKISSRETFSRDFALRDQRRRAAMSIMSNIAEGFDCSGNKEFIQFLSYSKASAAEVRSQLYIALDLAYIDQETFESLKQNLVSISRQLSGFMKYLKAQ